MSLAIPSRRPPAASPAGSPATKRARRAPDTAHVPQHPLRKAIASGKASVRAQNASKKLSSSRHAGFDDSPAVVAKGGDRTVADEVIPISSESESDDSEALSDDEDDVEDEEQRTSKHNQYANEDDDEEDEDDGEEDGNSAPAVQLINGNVSEDQDLVMINGDDDALVGAEREASPTFGELLQATAPEPIDVESTFVDPLQDTKAIAPASSKLALSAPSATSLGTVLTQALRTNDKELLESCFLLNDLNSVRSTIERLPSPLVATLLQKLADRLHKRPGRAGNLMVWVQWTLVSHGGYLASQPDVVKRLNGLNRVIRERASGLQPLLTLKGKLDMLSAQLELRRSMQKGGPMDDEDDERIIYVEGEELSSEDDEAEDEEIFKQLPAPKKPKKPTAAIDIADFDSADEFDEGDEMPTTVNGVGHSGDEEESDEEEEDMLDDEAEETENDTGDDETDTDEVDDELEEDAEDIAESDEEASDHAPPAKRSTAARSGFGRRK